MATLALTVGATTSACGSQTAAFEGTPPGEADPRTTASSAGSGGAGGESPGLTSLGFPAQDLIAAPDAGLIYATVAGTGPLYGNSLVAIDAETYAVRSAIFVGPHPNAMAISDDGTTMWIAIRGNLRVQRVDLTTDPPTLGPAYGLPGVPPYDATGPGDIEVLPGTTESVAVALHTPTGARPLAGMAILDDGVPRGAPLNVAFSPGRFVSGPPDVVFGARPSSQTFLTVASVDGQIQSTDQPLFLLDSGARFIFEAPLLFGSEGSVIDVTEPTAPVKLTAFPFDNNRRAPAIALTDRGLFRVAAKSNPTCELSRWDTTSFVAIGETSVPVDLRYGSSLAIVGDTVAISGRHTASSSQLADDPPARFLHLLPNPL